MSKPIPLVDALHDKNNLKPPSRQAWIIVLTASLFFFYEFIQMNMMDAISEALLQAFHINAEQLGDLSSYYFLANVIFLFIAGSLLDRYSTRRVMLIALGVCVFSTALFGLAQSYFWVTVCRFLTGIGSAFCFLSVLRLASRWFPAQHMAYVTGLVVTIAMTGGVVAQTPFEVLVRELGWRHTLLVDAGFGFFIWLLVISVVQDFPKTHQPFHQQEQQRLTGLGYFKSLKIAFLRRQNWLGGIYTSTINLPINVLGGLWGILYLTTAYHFTKIEASYITSMLFIGTIFGSPLAGWLSDRMARRKPLMIFGALISLAFIFCIIWLPNLSMGALLFLFFSIGFFSSTQIIGYPLVAESSPRIVTAMSVSVVNLTTIAGIGLIQRLYGYILQTHAQQRVDYTALTYLTSDFHFAMIIFFVGYMIALSASLLVKETYCVQREDS